MKLFQELFIRILILALFGALAATATFAATVTATVTVQNVAVSVNQASFDYGTVSLDTASSTVALFAGAGIVATNDGNVAADFDINGANTADYTLNSANTTQDNYIHRFCNDTAADCTTPPTNYTALTTSPAALSTSVAAAGTTAFQLQITTPLTVSTYAQQSAVVTITASAS